MSDQTALAYHTPTQFNRASSCLTSWTEFPYLQPMPVTKAELKEIMKRHYAKLGRKGSKARAARLTPARRAEIASLGGLARKRNWDLEQAKKASE